MPARQVVVVDVRLEDGLEPEGVLLEDREHAVDVALRVDHRGDLAVVHHVCITGNVPVREFVAWLRSLDTALVIEFPDRGDPMVARLLSGKGDGANPDYEQAGFERDPTPSSWLTKLWFGDVFIDVINTSTGPIYLDDEMLARGEKAKVWSRTLMVVGPEDLVVTKALAHGEETAHYWWDALAIIAGHELDWDYLLMRARRGPRRVLSLLLYAQSTDLAVPDPVVRQLSAVTLGEVE